MEEQASIIPSATVTVVQQSHSSSQDRNSVTTTGQLRNKPSFRLVCVVFGVLILAAAGVIAWLSLRNRVSDNDAVPEQESTASNAEYLDILQKKFLADTPGLDQSDPRLRSIEWLAFSDTVILDDNDPRLPQRYALLVLFFNNGGETWVLADDWVQPGVHECGWELVVCDSMERVVSMDFNGVGFSGRLPTEIGYLSRLLHLDLESNRIEGSFPSELYELTGLTHLSLYKNEIVSTISPRIGDFENLTFLDLSDNFFFGEVPQELMQCTLLQYLDISKNKFTGDSVWDVMVQLSGLELFAAAQNSISGQVPTEIGKLSNLTFIGLERNVGLAGMKLPSEIGLLTNLQSILGVGCGIEGTIPVEIGECTDLVVLELGLNLFDPAPFPSSLTSLSNIVALNLEDASLIGTIPTTIGTLTSMRALTLRQNYFVGSIPSEIGLLSLLEGAYFSLNDLEGTVPDEVCHLGELSLLIVDCVLECSCCGNCVFDKRV